MRKGKAEIATAVIDAQRHTFTTLVMYAMERGRFVEAEFLLQPLLAFWDFSGAWDEVLSWTGRIRALLEKANGGPPDLEQPVGHLWLYMVGSQARVWSRAGRLDTAAPEYERIRKLLESSTSPWGRRCLAMTCHNQALVAQQRRDLQKAEELYLLSLKIKEAENDQPSMPLTFRQLASIALGRGDLSQAEVWARKALEIDERERDLEGMAKSSHQLAQVAAKRGENDEAEAWYRRALAASTRQGHRDVTATLYESLGDLANYRNETGTAESYYQSALEMRERLTLPQGMPDLDRQLVRGSIFEERESKVPLASSYNRLAHLAYLQGDQEMAKTWLQKVMEVMQQQPGTAGVFVDWPPDHERQPRIFTIANRRD